MRTVAIVGMYKATLAEFDFNRTDCDVWAFNESLSKGNIPRADAIFQMHQPVIFRSKTNRNDPSHYDWLRTNRIVPVYMIDHYQDVPMSIAYPMDEILKEFPTAYRYFTSSVAYALALAIYDRYDKIEVYGVEMETQTEYGHQRDGVTYWVGFANGKGIPVDYHSVHVLKSPLYGAEGDKTVPIEFYREREELTRKNSLVALEAYKQKKQEVTQNVERFRKGEPLNGITELVVAQGQAAHDFNLFDGAFQVNQRHIAACQTMLTETNSYYLSRQVYESEHNNSASQWQAHAHKIKEVAEKLEVIEKEMRDTTNRNRRNRLCDEYLQGVEEYAHTIGKAGLLTGIGQESRLLMAKHDEMVRMLDGGRSECAPA